VILKATKAVVVPMKEQAPTVVAPDEKPREARPRCRRISFNSRMIRQKSFDSSLKDEKAGKLRPFRQKF